LREIEERLRSFMEAATEAFFLFDAELNYVLINEVGMKFFPPKTRPQDIVGQNILDIVPGIKETGRYDQYLKVIETGEPFFADDLVPLLKFGAEFLTIRAFKVGHGLGITAADITERVRMEEQIRASLQEKEVLLKEVHHRVKNNLQVISGLLEMSSRRAVQPEVIDSLTESRARIQTMALIHSQLYQSDRFDKIDLAHHLRQLVTFMEQAYAPQSKSITTSIEAPQVSLSITQAIPCALALNEVLANAYRHAFAEGQSGAIQIFVEYPAEADEPHPDTIVISVKDDGVGLPEEIEIDTVDSLGLKLVRGLIQGQLRGQVQIERDRGTRVTMEFKLFSG
jgi:two-component sensor histidine kinase